MAIIPSVDVLPMSLASLLEYNKVILGFVTKRDMARSSKIIGFSLPAKLQEAVDLYIEENHETRSEFLRQAIQYYLEHSEKERIDLVQGYHRARIEPSEAIDQSRYLGVHENSPVPIIRFVQSDQLEARLTYRLGKNSMRGEMLQRKIRAFQKHWHKISYQVLNEISKVTNIPWVEKDINVYLIPGVDSFSSPLCVAFRDNTDTTNTLVHELIHRNFRQIDTEKHRERMRQRIREVAQPFEPLLKLTRNHIVIHAVHKIIFDRCFKPAQEKRQRELHEKHGSYRRAWEIVDEVGAANIVKQFMR